MRPGSAPRTRPARIALAAASTALLLGAAPAAAQQGSRGALPAAIDSIVADALKDRRAAGMSVAVVRGRDTIVMKGYGFADLEYDIPTPDRAVYEIGSVTKQFTAVALLKLQEEGKLDLDDDLTKHLPDYPTRGHRIPLRRLLDHTSGIKGYTEMPAFRRYMTLNLPKDSLVALVKAEPFDFAPGEAEVYNNSAYFLAGLVIEKVSGMSYADYVEKNLFAKAGMRDSRYCSNNAIVKRRARGYEYGPDGLRRAAYLDHTWPYAAGSLCSTAGDLVAWNQALHGGRILSAESYRELITPETLNDGTRLRYAKGLTVDSTLGRRAIAHGGGINGFLSQLAYFPDERLSVAVLVNSTGPVQPGQVADAIAERVLGKTELKAAAYAGDLSQLTGEFQGVGRGNAMTVKFAVEGGALTAQSGQGKPQPLRYIGNETFEAPGGGRYTFVREGGRAVRVRADMVAINTVLARKN